MGLSDFIYKQDNKRVPIKPIDINGDFCAESRLRYAIDLVHEGSEALTDFEMACFQTGKKPPRKVVLSDPHRELIKTKPKSNATSKFFYAATMCVIGSMIALFKKNEAINIEKIVDAVAEHNELWHKGVSSFNNLFADDSDEYTRVAARTPNGKLIAANALTGLQFVCDLIKESRNLSRAGKHIDAAEIDIFLINMGLANLQAYLLLLSPEHPEFELLSNALDEYDNKYELCVGDNDEWSFTSVKDIKKIRYISDEIVAVMPGAGKAASEFQKSDEAVEDSDAEGGEAEVDSTLRPTDANPNTQQMEAEREDVSNPKPKSPDLSFLAGTEDEQSEEDFEENDDSEDLEENIAVEPTTNPHQYSAKRRNRKPPGLTDGEDKLGSTEDSGGSKFKAPSNAMNVDFSIDEL